MLSLESVLSTSGARDMRGNEGGGEREPDGKVNYYLAEGQIFRDDREMEFIRVMDLDIFVSVGVQSVKSI